MTRPRYYKLLGRLAVPLGDDVLEWAKWFSEASKSGARIVAQDEINEILVSTVFLGLDQRFWGEGDPILFETMIFGKNKTWDYMTRCSTYDQAINMHNSAVSYVKKKLKTESSNETT